MSFEKWYHVDTITIMAMTLRLPEAENLILEQMVEDLGCSKHQAVLTAIRAYDAKAYRQKQLDEIFNIVVVRDKELLERLADA